MQLLLIAALLTATNCVAQEPAMGGQPGAPPVQARPPVETEKDAITIPAGTHVQLILTNPMRARATHPGDSVRAMTAFPVTAGKQVAIPAGTYVEGAVDKVIKRGPSGHAGLQIHFTRIVFADGYNVLLDHAAAVARAGGADIHLPEVSAPESPNTAGLLLSQQQTPGLPPLPKLGPGIGVVAGIGVGVAAAATVGVILLGRRRSGDIVFDAGYQFEMVLETSLVLDADRVAAAMASSSMQ